MYRASPKWLKALLWCNIALIHSSSWDKACSITNPPPPSSVRGFKSDSPHFSLPLSLKDLSCVPDDSFNVSLDAYLQRNLIKSRGDRLEVEWGRMGGFLRRCFGWRIYGSGAGLIRHCIDRTHGGATGVDGLDGGFQSMENYKVHNQSRKHILARCWKPLGLQEHQPTHVYTFILEYQAKSYFFHIYSVLPDGLNAVSFWLIKCDPKCSTQVFASKLPDQQNFVHLQNNFPK